jgi:hypothetical protein
LAQAQAAKRHSLSTLRSATVKSEPVLRDRIAPKVERHGCGNNDVPVVAGEINMPWLAQSDVVARCP